MNNQDQTQEPFDYMEWQREHFSGMSLDELCAKAEEYCKSNPI